MPLMPRSRLQTFLPPLHLSVSRRLFSAASTTLGVKCPPALLGLLPPATTQDFRSPGLTQHPPRPPRLAIYRRHDRPSQSTYTQSAAGPLGRAARPLPCPRTPPHCPRSSRSPLPLPHEDSLTRLGAGSCVPLASSPTLSHPLDAELPLPGRDSSPVLGPAAPLCSPASLESPLE